MDLKLLNIFFNSLIFKKASVIIQQRVELEEEDAPGVICGCRSERF